MSIVSQGIAELAHPRIAQGAPIRDAARQWHRHVAHQEQMVGLSAQSANEEPSRQRGSDRLDGEARNDCVEESKAKNETATLTPQHAAVTPPVTAPIGASVTDASSTQFKVKLRAKLSRAGCDDGGKASPLGGDLEQLIDTNTWSDSHRWRLRGIGCLFGRNAEHRGRRGGAR